MALDRILRWRPLASGGLQHVRVREGSDHIRCRGLLIGQGAETGYGLSYEIVLGRDWTFRSLLVRTDTCVVQTLTCEAGVWRDGHDERRDLEGCVDIDLSGSPLTNTLPIRRVTDWTVGEPRRFEMVYVDLPSLALSRDGQIYTRLAADRFRYEAADGGFSAELTVDPDGFVADYPPLFARA